MGQRSEAQVEGYGDFIFESISVLEGGFDTGSRSQFYGDYGFDIDLQSLGIEQDTIFHVGFHTIQSDSPSELVGDFGALSYIDGYNTTRLAQVFVESNSGRNRFKFGLIGIDDDFMATEGGGLFFNANFGPAPIQSGNMGAPIWPVYSWGLVAEFFLETENPLMLGIYDGDAGSEEDNNRGVSADIGSEDGIAVFVEKTWNFTLGEKSHVLKVGGLGHFEANYDSFGSSKSKHSNHALYLVYEQEVREESYLFLRLGWSPNEEINPVKNYVEVGYTHPYQITEQMQSHLGIAITHTSFSSDFIHAEGFETTSESVVELSNPIYFSDHITVQPDFQIIFNPLQSNETAFVAGIRLIIGL